MRILALSNATSFFRPAARWLLAFVGVLLTATTAGAQIAYVQGNYTVPQSPQTTVNVPFTAAQTIGNLNLVAIGWNDHPGELIALSLN